MWNDCLPTSVAAVIRWLRGVSVPPDAIRDWAYGDGTQGYTRPGEIVPYLSLFDIPYEHRITSLPMPVLQEAAANGWPVLAWTYEPGGYYHWTPVTGLGDGQVIRHQVYGGYRETLPQTDWLSRYSGWLVIIQETV